MTTQQRIKELEDALEKSQKEVARLSAANSEQLNARVEKLEEKVKATPTYKVVIILMLCLVGVFYLAVRSTIPSHPYHGKHDYVISENHVEDREDDADKPDPNVILDRVFQLMERAMELEEKEQQGKESPE